MGTQGDLLRKWFKVVLSMIFVQKRVISVMNTNRHLIYTMLLP